MLRRDIVQGIAQVLENVRASKIYDALRANMDKAQLSAPLLVALRSYAIDANRYSPAAQEIAKIFRITPLEEPDAWMQILSGESSARVALSRALSVVTRELPLFLKLLDQESVGDGSRELIQGTSMPKEVDVVRVSLIESKGQFSTVKRVLEALSGCEEMYEALQRMNGVSGSVPLAIGPIDSGSDKSFDLFGAAELIKQFRELVLSIFGLVVFYREAKLGKQLEVIATALPVLEQIAALEQQQRLGREEAQIIRNGIVDGAKKFLAAGVITDDIESNASQDPRKLLAPVPKLLTGPTSTTPGTTPKSPEERSVSGPNDETVHSGQRISDEDLERLAELLSKKNRQQDEGAKDE